MIPAPDPIPDPVPMSEAEAATVLLTIAALHGGSVQQMADFRPNGALIDVGLAWMPDRLMPFWSSEETWLWSRDAEDFGWSRPDSCGDHVLPLGRIDRGLGAYRPETGNGSRG